MFCFKIVAVLGMHFCDPNQLIATKQRNKLAAANKALCYLTRGSFKEDQHTQASLTCVCLSLRLLEYLCEKCLARDCAQEFYDKTLSHDTGYGTGTTKDTADGPLRGRRHRKKEVYNKTPSKKERTPLA